MTVIHNARLADGRLYSIHIEGDLITQVVPQASDIQVTNPEAKSLAQMAVDQSPLLEPHIVNAGGACLVPGAIDGHVHSRDPGFCHKENWSTLSSAAFKGGVVAVADMPNTAPATVDKHGISAKLEACAGTKLDYRFFLGVTADNIDSIAELAAEKNLPICGIKVFYGRSTGSLFFDDLDKLDRYVSKQTLLVFHSEDQCRIDNLTEQYQTALQTTRKPHQFGIHSRVRDVESACRSSQVIIEWALKTGRSIHLAHISTEREMELIQRARRDGARITCEVGPHHLIFSTDDYQELGSKIKVNPPVRAIEEVRGLRNFFAHGEVDIFATDHAPHTLQEKSAPYPKCPSGIPSIEFYWPLLAHCRQISANKLSLDELVDLSARRPARRFGFDDLGDIAPGKRASFVWLEEKTWTISEDDVTAHCAWSPYIGRSMPWQVKATWHRGLCVYRQSSETVRGL